MDRKNPIAALLSAFISVIILLNGGHSVYGQTVDTIPARHRVTLQQAHVGDLHIDTLLLDSYEGVPGNVRQFYLDARSFFSENRDGDFTDSQLLASAHKHRIPLMGGPMLGDLKEDGVTLWLRAGSAVPLRIQLKGAEGGKKRSWFIDAPVPGEELRIRLDGLDPDAEYHYTICKKRRKIAEGTFKTAPVAEDKGLFTLAFGSCFHKIGLHNPNLINQILYRKPHAMLLLGDIAVDDRRNHLHMHRSDYLLRDVSGAWKELASNVPVYSAWDDHDYLDNDLSGIPDGITARDREALREVWLTNWNNPGYRGDGIYFNTRIGPVEVIMLDTRSCREGERRGEYGSYLGIAQQNWLLDVLKRSPAPFKVISSGTMWSDFITNGKDSWGTWDTLARQEIFTLIEKERIPGVILISGDRHGARAFKIPIAPGFHLYEFEVASLGGVPGPAAIAEDASNQLFGYHGSDIVAFGEFTFDTRKTPATVTFRLIDEFGTVLEEHVLPAK